MINIYCDESCHLEHDDSNVMVLGAISCSDAFKQKASEDIRRIKEKHNINSKVEVKWTKISSGKVELYKELIDYFFEQSELNCRIIVAENKKSLNHNKYNNGDPNKWYYKMYYLLLDKMCEFENSYRIFIDVKDTKGGPRIDQLKKVLCNNKYDYMGDIITRIDQVNSERVDLMQIVDIIIGATCYYHRELYNSPGGSKSKKEIVDHIIEHISENTLKNGNHLSVKKFNLFIWTPGYGRR